MELTPEQTQAWEQWLSERPEKVREVAQRIVPWKKYRLNTEQEDIGHRYSPRSYEEDENDEVTVTCEKSNEQMPFLGGYSVFGINPNDLIEAE